MASDRQVTEFLRAMLDTSREGDVFELGLEIGEYLTAPPVTTIRFRIGDVRMELTPHEAYDVALAIFGHTDHIADRLARQVWENVFCGFAREVVAILRKYCGVTVH